MSAANRLSPTLCIATLFAGMTLMAQEKTTADRLQEVDVRSQVEQTLGKVIPVESNAQGRPQAGGIGVQNAAPFISPFAHEKKLHDPPAPQAILDARTTSPLAIVSHGPFTSVQVNVNAAGDNIVGDAANEPTMAIDPNDSNKIAIVWRQFDSITSDFRQAGYAYSQDGGLTWAFSGVLGPGEFRSDPVLDTDAEGNFYLCSMLIVESGFGYDCTVFKSADGGVTWEEMTTIPCGDKPWMVIDRTDGIGRGNIYLTYGGHAFTRSTDGGQTFDAPFVFPDQEPIVRIPSMGTMAVDPEGTVYCVGNWGLRHAIAKSSTAANPAVPLAFDFACSVDLGGWYAFSAPYFYSSTPNAEGLLNQTYTATDHSGGPYHGYVYYLGPVWPGSYILDPPGPIESDPHAIHFMRSADGGLTWSTPIRLSDDRPGSYSWQWFGTMSVAPDGRIDVVWNDTRNTGAIGFSELVYSYSRDAGETWTPSVPVTPMFNSHLGWPQQNKLGDYYDMVSQADGASLAFAATFNGEQDIYYLWIPADCNENGVPDDHDIAGLTSDDCDGNGIPDECEVDCNDNGRPDRCDMADGTSDDVDGSGVPDECECSMTCDAPVHEDPVVAKTRYVSITQCNVGQQTAVRVRFLYMPSPFESLSGSSLFVGEPVTMCENAGQAAPPPEGCGPAPGLEDMTFLTATLQAEPYYMDWSTVGTIHITHESIVPGADFAVQAIDESCDIHFENQYSALLLRTTSRWGDIVEDCTTTPCTPPDGMVNVTTDVTALLDKFKNLAGAPEKIRCDLEPALPDRLINISDVTYCLDAFKGFGYPFVEVPSILP